jgi:osmotically-inducible protein OsmY
VCIGGTPLASRDRGEECLRAPADEERVMSTATLTDKDLHLRDAVMHQLEWEPAVDSSGIGVTARAGAVVLSGSIPTYAAKLAAERAAKRVRGVRAVANDLEVTLAAGRTDADIAADAAAVLRLHGEVPDVVQVSVNHGHVTLTGTVQWHYQRLQAEKAVRYVEGVRDLVNRISIDPKEAGRDLHRRIAKALHRNASLDASRIDVRTADGVAFLTGKATSWDQRQAAERAAYDAPGVTMVDNQIVVEPPDGDTWEIC